MNKKLYLTLATAATLLAGCGKDSPSKDNTEALLIDKDIFPNGVMLYLDTDGNPETAEAGFEVSCSDGTYSVKAHLEIFNEAKIGTYKTIAQWHKVVDKDYLKVKYVKIKE